MNERKPSSHNHLVDSKGFFTSRVEQEMMDRLGYVARPDYNGEHAKSLQENSEKSEEKYKPSK